MERNIHRQRARRVLIFVALVAAACIAAYGYLSSSVSLKKLTDIQQFAEHAVLTEIERQVSTPPPLRAKSSAPQVTPPVGASTALTRSGIIAETNSARKENGNLPPLVERASLDDIAARRLDDMFVKQYFAHVAPDGGSVETVAKTVGYSYAALGENLALGNYAGDRGVVAAWMGSPGHRANILNDHYVEIGVAARQGLFEGERTWIAVQVFGKPIPDCPSPDADLKAAIDGLEAQLSQMETEIQAKRAEIESMEPKRGSEYNQKVDEYNGMVSQYNVLLGDAKAKISTYNGEVVVFNQCIGT